MARSLALRPGRQMRTCRPAYFCVVQGMKMHRVFFILLCFFHLQQPAFALDISCAWLSGGRDAYNAESWTEESIQKRAAVMQANPAWRRPFDFESFLIFSKKIAIQPEPQCASAVFTGKIEASDVVKVERFSCLRTFLSQFS